jgi:hypothetical protein
MAANISGLRHFTELRQMRQQMAEIDAKTAEINATL